MIEQRFTIPEYDWDVHVYYKVTTYYKDEILHRMKSIGCNKPMLDDAYRNMAEGRLNTGICYSNLPSGQSVIVISRTSSPDEFLNSLMHEIHHLVCHISQAIGIDPYGEEAAYLAGSIGLKVYPEAKRFMCSCHRDK